MDTTKEYGKMIFALPEEFWADFVETESYLENTGQFCKNCGRYVRDTRVACCEKMNRLSAPRQDQLQGMVGDLSLEKLLLGVYEQYENSTHLVGYGLSMEQLWLAFVMSEKYNKTWNGSEWKEDK